ncbi:SHS2 domain-containing protein [Hydrogenivirga caldilitoris]|uniref:SHS2 domain-containing protein n=1 Tax=Hydrogenivirga caldilitoris TaxID=246264 RepID=A0A497XMG7_9AQUI|nr:archease [Hydrogenivirga caldilitoris]RLJ70106.1 SHS2 domain-containing protein [Hydrogenivirga caldilitoris]
MFYETIDDITADAGIRVWGNSLEDVFCKALLATFNEMTDIATVEKKESYEIQVRSPLPFLLADLINEAIVLHESKGFVASECEVLKLEDDSVKVRLRGEKFDPQKHPSKLVIKAATYHRLKVAKEGERYVAEVIFDI